MHNEVWGCAEILPKDILRDRIPWHNRNMAQFNLELCSCVVVLVVFLPLASGEHHIISNLLERFIFIWILHLAEIVGYVFQFWELELKTSAYHRNLIANAVSIKTKKIRVLFINLGTDTKLSLKTILSKACLGMWPNNWINLGLSLHLLNAKACSSDFWTFSSREHEPFCRKIHSHPWKPWVLKLIEQPGRESYRW